MASARLQLTLFENLVEQFLFEPTFIVDYPPR